MGEVWKGDSGDAREKQIGGEELEKRAVFDGAREQIDDVLHALQKVPRHRFELGIQFRGGLGGLCGLGRVGRLAPQEFFLLDEARLVLGQGVDRVHRRVNHVLHELPRQPLRHAQRIQQLGQLRQTGIASLESTLLKQKST